MSETNHDRPTADIASGELQRRRKEDFAPRPRVLAGNDVAKYLRTVVSTEAYLSLKGLAVYSGLSVRRLRECLHDHDRPLPCYRIGGKILVRKSDFDAWAMRFRKDEVSIDALVDEIAQGLE